ncbi:MAG TPA: hypothetical protein DCS07_16445 [Bdellovibrionales bacterium]|nr:MAG: hypothetical protein A2Z97_15785 [Bdellovibrionales bacterium GWB1_52_6]OFZ06427.1 MAG: hypothetical protein A2X97_03130 [Bdellovibrionales bacterium GWA1_52_35]OFZ40056.1 MAG: hypothetical protein A2070_02470 [Bdellovibrionales bacterium GWC1_52_8]HAR44195.1 hypothetical protein [Bdellovibrionales bacterium]HCM40186.1 hypothetical protein [Bdellovibrionales bacterium]
MQQQSLGQRKLEKAKKQSAEIRLLGQKIALKCSEEDPELVDETVELVSVLLRNSEMRTRSKVPHQVVLLALLDLAEEYLRAKRRTLVFKRQVTEKSQKLLSLMDEAGAR